MLQRGTDDAGPYSGAVAALSLARCGVGGGDAPPSAPSLRDLALSSSLTDNLRVLDLSGNPALLSFGRGQQQQQQQRNGNGDGGRRVPARAWLQSLLHGNDARLERLDLGGCCSSGADVLVVIDVLRRAAVFGSVDGAGIRESLRELGLGLAAPAPAPPSFPPAEEGAASTPAATAGPSASSRWGPGPVSALVELVGLLRSLRRVEAWGLGAADAAAVAEGWRRRRSSGENGENGGEASSSAIVVVTLPSKHAPGPVVIERRRRRKGKEGVSGGGVGGEEAGAAADETAAAAANTAATDASTPARPAEAAAAAAAAAEADAAAAEAAAAEEGGDRFEE